MGQVFPDSLFNQEKIHIFTYKNIKYVTQMTTSRSSSSWITGRSSGSSPPASNVTGDFVRDTEDDLKKLNTDLCRGKDLIASKHPHNFLFSSCCRLFESKSSNTLMPASISQNPSVKFVTVILTISSSGSVSDSSASSRALASEFQKYFRVWAPDHLTSTNKKYLQRRTLEFVRLAILGLVRLTRASM